MHSSANTSSLNSPLYNIKANIFSRISKSAKILFSVLGTIFLVIILTIVLNGKSKIETVLETAQIKTKEVYKLTEKLEFTVEFNTAPQKIVSSKLQPAYAEETNQYSDGFVQLRAELRNNKNTVVPVPFEIKKLEDNKYQITGDAQEMYLDPGKYNLNVEMKSGGYTYVHEKDFSWGVLALNTNKSDYLINETAKFQIAVLDDIGDMVCDALVSLEVTSPSKKTSTLSTDDGTITVNDGCSKKEFIWEPDYEAYYKVNEEVGDYDVRLTAVTKSGVKTISDKFTVKNSSAFDTERISVTRIYPREKYPVIFKINANENYQGEVTEIVQKDFKIFELSQSDAEYFTSDTNIEYYISALKVDAPKESNENNQYKNIKWNVNFEKGRSYYFGYWYDAPDKSPNLFTSGPLSLGDDVAESRRWQIAVDWVISIPHVSVFTDTADTGANTTINVFENVDNTTISHATMATAGFDDTDDVLIIMDVVMDGNNANSLYSVQAATTGGTAVYRSAERKEPNATANRAHHYRWIGRTTKTSSQGFVVQKAYHTFGQTSPYVYKASMVILSLGSLTEGVDFVYAENTTDTGVPANASPGSFSTATTPENSSIWNGNVLVLHSFGAQADVAAGDELYSRLYIDGSTAVNITSIESEDTTEELGGGGIYVNTQNDTNAHTYAQQLYNSDGSTNSYDHIFSSVTVFPANLFEDFEYYNNDAELDLAGTTYEEIGGVTPFSPRSTGDFLVMGHAVGTGAGATNGENTRIRVQVGGTNVPSGYDDTADGGYFEITSDDYNFNVASIESFNTSSKDVDMDGASSVNTVDFYYRTLVAFSFGLNTIDISGTAYTDDDEATPLASCSVCVAVDATYSPSNCATTDGSGNFTIVGVAATAGGEQLTLFVDGSSVRGNIVMKGDGADVSGIKLYQNHVVVRYETGTSLAITDMDAYDSDQNAVAILFDAEDATTDTLEWVRGVELFVPSGFTFAPGGNCDGAKIEIDGTWTSATAQTINLAGNFKLDTGGTWTSSTSTLTFDSASGVSDIITTGTGGPYNLTINDNGGSLTVEVEDSLVVKNNLTITGGVLDVNATDTTTVYTTFALDGTSSFLVPTGITSITAKAWGGGGGGGGGGSSSSGGSGGGGGFAQATLTVTPGETLSIHVGGGGGLGIFGGSYSGYGGGGSGESYIRRAGTLLLAAAGGGGGGGGDNSSTTAGGDGGPGGGTLGTDGSASGTSNGGGGGTQATGGSGGTGGGNAGADGSLGTGGLGANGGADSSAGDGGAANGGTTNGGAGGIYSASGYAGGGGGGSGYYGGGGGSGSTASNAGGGGGGGGSSYTTGSGTVNTAGSGTSAGNNSDGDYNGSAGIAGTGGATNSNGTDGNDGYIIISYTTGGSITSQNNQINVGNNWDNDDSFESRAGTVIMDGSGATTYTMDADGPGSDTFYNLTLNDSGGNSTYQLTTVLDVNNDLTITGGTLQANGNDIYVGGDWINNDIFSEGTNTVYLDIGQNASLDTGCADANTCTNQNFYNLVIDKGLGGDIVTLTDELRVTNTFTITSGEFVQTTGDVRLEGATTSLLLSDYGRYTNNSTGDLTLGGGVINDYGEITLNSNGSGCGDAKDIIIASTATAQRAWSGEGANRIIDVSVSYQSGSATIKAASSTDGGNNDTNWLFIDCGIFDFEGLNIEGTNIN